MPAERGFHQWCHQARENEKQIVFPDGCRDVLLIRPPDQPVRVVLTAFDLGPRRVELSAGLSILGFRLRPGASLSAATIDAIAQDPDRIGCLLDEACGTWSELDDAIAALTEPGATTRLVARRLGVSVRTMQRHFLARALPPPDFWRLLARARRAAAMIDLPVSLADIAADCGFSDQAHLTRDLVRWFGVTPAQLRRNVRVLALLRQPALGNWTGEQISTR